jgi:hypothetical protein
VFEFAASTATDETFECVARDISHVTRGRSPPATTTVGERLRTLDHDAFVDFCAALWRARGYETRVTGDRFVARRSHDRLVVLVPPTPGPVRAAVAAVEARLPWGTAPSIAGSENDDYAVDVVVAPVDASARRLAGRYDARPVGPRTLANRLLYGIPRERANALTRRHLGVSTASLLAADATTPPPSPRRSPAALVVAGVACLVVAAAVAGVWSPGALDGLGDGAATPPPGAGSGLSTTAPDASNPSSDASGSDDRPGWPANRYPPGVGNDTVYPAALADAHAAVVAGRSYRLLVRQSDTDPLGGGPQWDDVWQHAVVDENGTWLYAVVGYARTAEGRRLVQYTAYADGTFVYHQSSSGSGPQYDRYPARATTDDGRDAHVDRAHRALRRYLATTDVRVDRPSWRPDMFRVVATGRPTAVDGTVSNYTATAFVDEGGFVSELAVEYTRHTGHGAESVRFRFEYVAVDEATLRPPGWYDEARAATAANGTRD